MPITIDEVTAEVAPQERGGRSDQSGEAKTPTPSQLRRQRDQIERLKQRAMRLKAD